MTFEYPGISASEFRPRRAMEVDGSSIDIFPLSVDEASLEALLRDLFENHWREIVFGPIIEGAAYEFRAPSLPTHIGIFDGYLTIAFGLSHFHICIGPHRRAADYGAASQSVFRSRQR